MNANQQQQRRNSNGPLFQAAQLPLHCNTDCTNNMESVELYTLGEMDDVCQFCGAIGLCPKRGMDKYLLENYAAMEIKLIHVKWMMYVNFVGLLDYVQKEEWTSIFWKIMLQWK